jgi:hypothetical protein
MRWTSHRLDLKQYRHPEAEVGVVQPAAGRFGRASELLIFEAEPGWPSEAELKRLIHVLPNHG